MIPGESRQGFQEIALDDIIPDRSQPRVRFDEDRIAELAESIKIHGVLQPLIVSKADENGKHRLIVGERRWQAARIAGLETVPAIEREAAPESAMEVALVENLQRQDLDPLEEAAAFDRLIREHGLTQDEVGRRVGRSRSSIANSLRLLSLPTAVSDALIEGRITEGHARALLGLEDVLVVEMVLRSVLAEELSVRETERLVSGMRDRRPDQQMAPREQPPELRALEDQLRLTLGTKVTIQKGRKSGRIVIEYYSREDLDSLLDRLLNS